MAGIHAQRAGQDLDDLHLLPVLVPFTQAEELRAVLSKIRLKLPKNEEYEIRINGSRIDIYGKDGGIVRYKLENSSAVQQVSLNGEEVELDLHSETFTKLVLHTSVDAGSKKTRRSKFDQSLSSSGESRSGYSSRACG